MHSNENRVSLEGSAIFGFSITLKNLIKIHFDHISILKHIFINKIIMFAQGKDHIILNKRFAYNDTSLQEKLYQEYVKEAEMR